MRTHALASGSGAQHRARVGAAEPATQLAEREAQGAAEMSWHARVRPQQAGAKFLHEALSQISADPAPFERILLSSSKEEGNLPFHGHFWAAVSGRPNVDACKSGAEIVCDFLGERALSDEPGTTEEEKVHRENEQEWVDIAARTADRLRFGQPAIAKVATKAVSIRAQMAVRAKLSQRRRDRTAGGLAMVPTKSMQAVEQEDLRFMVSEERSQMEANATRATGGFGAS